MFIMPTFFSVRIQILKNMTLKLPIWNMFMTLSLCLCLWELFFLFFLSFFFSPVIFQLCFLSKVHGNMIFAFGITKKIVCEEFDQKYGNLGNTLTNSEFWSISMVWVKYITKKSGEVLCTRKLFSLWNSEIKCFSKIMPKQFEKLPSAISSKVFINDTSPWHIILPYN